MTHTNCQAHVAEAVIRETGVLRTMSFLCSRPVDVSGAAVVSGCSFYATEPYKRDIEAMEAIARSAEFARQAEIDRLRDLGFVLRGELDDEE